MMKANVMSIKNIYFCRTSSEKQQAFQENAKSTRNKLLCAPEKGCHQIALDIQIEYVEHVLYESKKKGEACSKKIDASEMIYDHTHWYKGCLNSAKAMCNYASVTDSTQYVTEIISQKEEQSKTFSV